MVYKKPEIKSYSSRDLLEEIGPCQNQYTTTFYSVTGHTGRNIDGIITYVPGTDSYAVNSAINLTAGESGAGPGAYDRSVVGFDISSLAGKTIVSATLRLYQARVDETPYGAGSLGDIVVDHVDFGNSLDSSDFNDNTIQSNIGTISSTDTVEWKTLSVKNQMQADINAGRTSSQFRIRFTTTSDGPPIDQALVESSENYYGTTNRPHLIITYT